MEHGPDMHPLAPHHMPFYVTAPGHTDGLLVVTGMVVLLAVIGIGVLYFKLHALPEQLAHRGQKVQFEIVAVLALLALFTHNHIFWIAALLLAFVPVPDFMTPLNSMAQSLGRMAGRNGRVAPSAVAVVAPSGVAVVPPPMEAKHLPARDIPVEQQRA